MTGNNRGQGRVIRTMIGSDRGQYRVIEGMERVIEGKREYYRARESNRGQGRVIEDKGDSEIG